MECIEDAKAATFAIRLGFQKHQSTMYPGAPGYGAGYGAYPGAMGAYPGAPPSQNAPTTAAPTPQHSNLTHSAHSATYYASYGTPPPPTALSTSQPGTPPVQHHAPLLTAASAPVILPSQQPYHPVGIETKSKTKIVATRKDFKIVENTKDLHSWMVKQPDFTHYDITDRFRDVFHDVAGPMWSMVIWKYYSLLLIIFFCRGARGSSKLSLYPHSWPLHKYTPFLLCRGYLSILIFKTLTLATWKA